MQIFIVPVVLYLLVIVALFIFGVNFFYLTFLAWREGRREGWREKGQPPVEPIPDEWPRVTVQLPIYNELYVAERVIAAAAALEYPRGLLEIQVLDDSTDETAGIVAGIVGRLQAEGVDIDHLQRSERSGYKAGALQAGLERSSGEFIAFFDADFVPPADFLRRVLGHFDQQRVAFVQARWGHLNRNYSLLTYLQSLTIDAHFMVEQFARSRGGYWFNFNGTAGVWRREALEDVGGWKADTLTEDLDISYRAYLRGWEGRYVRDVEVPAELPVSIGAFRRQQHRWARGSLECALKFFPQVLGAVVPPRIKVQAILHLLGYMVHLLLFAVTLMYPVIVVASGYLANWVALFGIAYLFNVTALAPTLFFVVGQQQLGRLSWRRLPGQLVAILFVSAVGSGMMVNTVRAAWQIAGKRQNVFERTAKFGVEQQKRDWTRQRYQLQLDPIVWVEFLIGIYAVTTAVLAVGTGHWAIALYATLFGSGLLFVAGLTVVQAVAVSRGRRRGGEWRVESEEWGVEIGD